MIAPIRPDTVSDGFLHIEYIEWSLGHGPKPQPSERIPTRISFEFVYIGRSTDPLAATLGIQNVEMRVQVVDHKYRSHWYRKLENGKWERPIWLN